MISVLRPILKPVFNDSLYVLGSSTPSFYTIATALSGNTQTITLVILGTGTRTIQWALGVEEVIDLDAGEEFSHTYTGQTPNIRIDDPTGITELDTSDMSSDFTVSVSNVNQFTDLEFFQNVEANKATINHNTSFNMSFNID
jgi:hypothetical protein